MQLRLGITHGAMQKSGNFVVSVAFYVMQNENGPASSGQLTDGATKRDAVYGPQKLGISASKLARNQRRVDPNR